jgi:hypothetical protein
MGIYLYPLFTDHLYVPVYDNLDSNVVWEKILAHSGKIFASNDTIIPNMMNGLPRVSYGSEFSLILWLYYFFGAKTAFVINEVLIHVIAFAGAYLLLSRYIVPKNKYYSYSIIFAGSIYFATLPFWSNSGISIASIPLTTYVLLNIKNHIDTKLDWLYLILLPLYSSFIFIYVFYIIFAGIYWIYNSFKQHKINWRLFGAIFLLGVIFLLTEYRLIYSMFIDSSFISHRVEFDVYLNHNTKQAYIYAIKFFLDGWMQHQRSLMMPYLLPLSIFGMLVSFSKRKFSDFESLIIWLLLALSFAVDIWHIILTNGYTLPLMSVFALWLIYRGGEQKILGILLLVNVILAVYLGLCFYGELSFLKEWFPILKSFNISRAAFVQPLIWMILLAYIFKVLLERLSFSTIILVAIITIQSYYAIKVRLFDTTASNGFLTFEQYYMPEVYTKLKKDIKEPLSKVRFVNYGIEPAVTLYNGLYTVDGYSTNYPLYYKHLFHDVQDICFKQMPGNDKLYNGWGSKVYLLCADSRPGNYHFYSDKNTTKLPFVANIDKLCKIGTRYVISILPLKNAKDRGLIEINHYEGSFYHIWLYQIDCKKKDTL